MSATIDYTDVTEIAGDEVSAEQIERLCQRYYWALEFCRGKNAAELACGTGQGLGLISKHAKRLVAGDFSRQILRLAQRHYQNRINLIRLDAQGLPFSEHSLDIFLLFEAIYYLQDASLFVGECKRILRPGGKVLISTANPDLFDFNPSPYSHRYYGTMELADLFDSRGFHVQCFGGTPVGSVSLKQKILRPVKKLIVDLNMMPKSMAGKKFFKRLVFGKLVPMPAEITEDTAQYSPPVPIPSNIPDKKHKVIYCAATLEG